MTDHVTPEDELITLRSKVVILAAQVEELTKSRSEIVRNARVLRDERDSLAAQLEAAEDRHVERMAPVLERLADEEKARKAAEAQLEAAQGPTHCPHCGGEL